MPQRMMGFAIWGSLFVASILNFAHLLTHTGFPFFWRCFSAAMLWRSDALFYAPEFKLFWGVQSAIIAATGYSIYGLQMFPPAGKAAVKPAPLSWFMFFFLTAAGALVQGAQGAAAGTLCLAISAIACLAIAVTTTCKFGWHATRLQKASTTVAILIFIFSVFAKSHANGALAAACLATFADFLSYHQIFEKGLERPHEDSVTNFAFNSVKCVPAYFALDSYVKANWVYLLMLFVVNGLFALFLITNRFWQVRQRI